MRLDKLMITSPLPFQIHFVPSIQRRNRTRQNSDKEHSQRGFPMLPAAVWLTNHVRYQGHMRLEKRDGS